MSALFSPLKIKSIELKNRLIMSPMCQYSAIEGMPTDWHYQHYVSRAVGGVAAIIQEATAVNPEGRISYGDLGLWNESQAQAYKIINNAIEMHGCVPGIQIAHAGRKGSYEVSWLGSGQLKEGPNSWQTVAPSAIPFHEKDNLPHALTVAEIQQVIADFKKTAMLALSAGFKILEIHGAHGYLIHEFYSAYSNKRTDEYGGSFENRVRFLLEIVDAIKEVWPSDYPLFVRISATDWIDEEADGWKLEDSIRLASLLKAKGVDLIDTSTGANVRKAVIPVGPNYQVPFAAAIKKEAEIMTGAVGLIKDASTAEAILNDNAADLIFIGRALLSNPYLPLAFAKELNEEAVKWPVQYERAK